MSGINSESDSEGGRRTRIDNLAARGIITKDIATWSHDLWDDGNDAIHDLDADMDTAIEHVEFLKLFFEVAFVLPAKIAASKNSEPEGAQPVDEPAQQTRQSMDVQ